MPAPGGGEIGAREDRLMMIRAVDPLEDRSDAVGDGGDLRIPWQ